MVDIICLAFATPLIEAAPLNVHFGYTPKKCSITVTYSKRLSK